MKNIFKTKILLSVLSIVFAGECLAETYEIATGPFEKLKINGDIRVVYKNMPDSTGMASYEAPAGNQRLFSFTTKGGTLKVEPGDEEWGSKDLPVIYLYSDFLTSVESYSNENVEIQSAAPSSGISVTLVGNGTISVNDIKCTTVSASLSTGNGSIYLSGECTNATFRMVGTGLISADRLQAENVKCRILGTGSIGCWPVDNLNVSGLGSTKIYYKGKPNIKKVGGGKLYELPEEDRDRSGAEIKSLNMSE